MKSLQAIFIVAILATFTFLMTTSMTNAETKQTKAYLEITLDIKPENRPSAAEVYVKYKKPFLKKIEGATSKELLMRGEDVQVLHGFESEEMATAYLSSKLFQEDVVVALKPYLEGNPEIRVYTLF